MMVVFWLGEKQDSFENNFNSRIIVYLNIIHYNCYFN